MSSASCDMIQGRYYPIYLGNDIRNVLSYFMDDPEYTGLFILTDENVNEHCLRLIISHVPRLADANVFILPPGEGSKDIRQAEAVWEWLSSFHAERSALLINLGGGVVSDLGGFAAGAFKRGIPYINIPTTLIGQADAAIGGKTGTNIGHYKNQIGHFYHPRAVFINPLFLKTLPFRELNSGFAEIIKTALVTGGEFWADLNPGILAKEEALLSLIRRTAGAKLLISDKDPEDRLERKCLNFGHTIGHALEGLSHKAGINPLLHGEAVAAGMVCEAFMSASLNGLDNHVLQKLMNLLRSIYPHFDSEFAGLDEIILFALRDKKNAGGEILFTLLKAPGIPVLDQPVPVDLIRQSLEFYRESFTDDQC